MARRWRVRRAGVPQRVRHCCQCCRSGAPVHLRIRKEEEDAAPECSPGRELVRVQQVEIGRLSVTRGGVACAGGRMRGCAGAPADECGQVARMRALLAKARTRGGADRCQAGGRAGGQAGGQRHANDVACKKAGAGVPPIARNRLVHRLLRQKEDEAAPERFPGRVSHSQSRQTAARWAENCGHWAPEDQHAILRINRRRMVLKLLKFIGLGAPRAWLP
jgi:hypothetical protein